MPAANSLRVLDAATSFAADVGRLIETAEPPLVEAVQLRSAVNSIGANIAEGFGRGPGRDRLHFYRIARGSTEEAIQHLRLNYKRSRLTSRVYYGFANRGVVIIKMLNVLGVEADSGNQGRQPGAATKGGNEPR